MSNKAIEVTPLKRSAEEQTNVENKETKKVRQVEHVTGNWPSFAYIELNEEDNIDQVNLIIDKLNKSLQLKGNEKMKVIIDEEKGCHKMHISLTKLFFLRNFQIEPFVNEVRKSVKASPFHITLSSTMIFTNEDKSRSFCSILVQKGFHSVVGIIKQLDSVLEKFKRERYYDPPVPHCTIGSCISDLSEIAKDHKIYGNEYVEEDEYDSDDEDAIDLFVDRIYLSIGNQLHTISF